MKIIKNENEPTRISQINFEEEVKPLKPFGAFLSFEIEKDADGGEKWSGKML